jgi:hypothetical protein
MALALIHQGRSKEADELLARDGVFFVRLADQVFNYAGPGPTPTLDCPVGAAFDGLLPRALVERLNFFLRDDAPFWANHDYYSGKVTSAQLTIVSHSCRRATLAMRTIWRIPRERCSSKWPLCCATRWPLICPSCAAPARLSGGRTIAVSDTCIRFSFASQSLSEHEMGHQLHWDTDAEGVSGVKNPLVSVIIYLSYGVGGPTAMTEQRLGEPIATHGWLVPVPERAEQMGRVAAFRGAYLHGVVGGHPHCEARRDARRKTLMIAFWEDVKIRPSLFETPGACRPLPASRPAWLAEMERPVAEPGEGAPGAHVPVSLLFVKPFFASVEGKDLATMEMPPYESVFQ